jgi:hypothetical protein
MCPYEYLEWAGNIHHHVELEKGEVLAYAEEVCSKVEPVGIQNVEVAEQEVQEKGKREIPEHLANLFEKSNGKLNEQEQTQPLD